MVLNLEYIALHYIPYKVTETFGADLKKDFFLFISFYLSFRILPLCKGLSLKFWKLESFSEARLSMENTYINI